MVDIVLKAHPEIRAAVLQLKCGKGENIETGTLEQLSIIKPDPQEVRWDWISGIAFNYQTRSAGGKVGLELGNNSKKSNQTQNI